MNDLSCDVKTIPTHTFMHTDNISCNHGCALDGTVARQGDGFVHGTIDGVLNLPETYDSGSEPMKDLPCDIKTIPTPTFMHTDKVSCNHGCALDGAVDGSVHGAFGGVLNLPEAYDSGSEPMNDYHVISKPFKNPHLRMLIILHATMVAPWTGLSLD